MTAYTDFHYSPTGSGVISGAQVLEQTEQGINGLGQYVQDNVSGAIDTANQALTTAQNADSNATAAINLANSFNAQIIAANQTAGNALTTAQSAQNTANSASSLATTANNNAATALNTANAASSAVTTLTGTVNSLGNRMTAAENAISANAGNITTLQNNLATTNANVTAAANAASSAQATATSAQSTATLARNQAYVLRYTGTTITGGGTIAYADIDNTDNIKAGDKIIDISGAIYAIASVDIANQTVTVGASPVINLFCDAENLIPAATDTYDLGSASKQWLNTYSKGYFYNGVAWGLDKNNTWSTEQIIEQSTIASFKLKNSNMKVGDAISGSLKTVGSLAFTGSDGVNFGYMDLRDSVLGDTFIRILSRQKYDANGNRSNNGTNYESGIDIGVLADKTPFVCPSYDSTTHLGTSNNQWKTLNGVNPGALSLPKSDTSVTAISVSSFSFDGSNERIPDTVNLFSNGVALVDGWLCARLKEGAGHYIFLNSDDNTNKTGIISSCFSSGVVSTLLYGVNVYVPVKAGDKPSIRWAKPNGGNAQLVFSPCLGNV